jgi:hypothetical protein
LALNKTFITPHGVTAFYHKLIKVELNTTNNIVEMLFAVYVNKQAREEGAQPLWYQTVSVPFSEFDHDPRSVFYNAAKDYSLSYLYGAENELADADSTNPSNVLNIKPVQSI